MNRLIVTLFSAWAAVRQNLRNTCNMEMSLQPCRFLSNSYHRLFLTDWNKSFCLRIRNILCNKISWLIKGSLILTHVYEGENSSPYIFLRSLTTPASPPLKQFTSYNFLYLVKLFNCMVQAIFFVGYQISYTRFTWQNYLYHWYYDLRLSCPNHIFTTRCIRVLGSFVDSLIQTSATERYKDSRRCSVNWC